MSKCDKSDILKIQSMAEADSVICMTDTHLGSRKTSAVVHVCRVRPSHTHEKMISGYETTIPS